MSDIQTKEIYENLAVRPFSNGTEAMLWEESNCGCCALNANKGQLQSTLLRRAREGTHCLLECGLSVGYITGSINEKVATEMGWSKEGGFPWRCAKWKDRGNGGGPKGKPRKPKPGPKTQMLLPFHSEEKGSDLIKKSTPVVGVLIGR